MKQAVMTAPGKIEIHQIDPPTPGKGEVLLRSQRIAPNGWRAYPVTEVARLKRLKIS